MTISGRRAATGLTRTSWMLAASLAAVLPAAAMAQQGDGGAMKGAESEKETAPPTSTTPLEVKPADPKWFDRLPKLDRALLDSMIGFAPPAFTEDLTWEGGEERSWSDLRGKVVLVQSWTTQRAGGRSIPMRVEKTLEELDSSDGASADDVVVLLLHTPEGADRAKMYLERQPVERTVLIDESGAFSDAMGVYKRPVNVIIDRQGAVRYAGVEWSSLPTALGTLVKEEFDAEAEAPPVRARAEAQEESFPPISGGVRSASDIRGQRAPEFYVERWMTDRPNASGKVVVLDFWATWCPPCRASIPHMNELARAMGNDVVIVGVSDESKDDYEEGLDKHNLKQRNFEYAIALDRSGRMKRAIGIRGIPHAIVVSSDWVVRWQGHPAQLTESVLRQIVSADKSMHGAAEDADNELERARGRWARELKR